MTKTTKILIVLAVLLLAVSPSIAERTQSDSLFQLGNAERNYQDGAITCYLGHLYAGMPIYWCGYMKDTQFIMIHSYFANQVPRMNLEMSGASTTTYTAKPK